MSICMYVNVLFLKKKKNQTYAKTTVNCEDELEDGYHTQENNVGEAAPEEEIGRENMRNNARRWWYKASVAATLVA